MIQRERRPTSLSEWPRGETSGSTNEFIGKTTTMYIGIYVLISSKAASTFCPPDGGKRHARGTRESASGGLPAG